MKLSEISAGEHNEAIEWLIDNWSPSMNNQTARRNMRQLFGFDDEGRLISLSDTVPIRLQKIKEIKYPIGDLKEEFALFESKLDSLKNFPPSCESVRFIKCKVKSLEGLDLSCRGDIYFDCGMNNLKDIHKHVKKMNGTFHVDLRSLRSHVLGLILINGCQSIKTSTVGTPEQFTMLKIIDKHLGKGKSGMLAAQAELIDADLENYAEL